jgi:5-methylcytosine-specific restriction endonuclease McrA
MTGSRAFLVLERAMKERLLARSFGTDERMSALQYFKEVGVTGCIYCDREAPERWDHLIPIRDGGATVIGNMVPACQLCDDSKSSKHYLKSFGSYRKRVDFVKLLQPVSLSLTKSPKS